MRDTEILVHVSAPSGARDDARYRALVDAASAFEAVSRQDVFSEDVIDIGSPTRDGMSPRSSRAFAPEEDERMNSGDELESVISTRSFPRPDTTQSKAIDQALVTQEHQDVVSISTELSAVLQERSDSCSLHQESHRGLHYRDNTGSHPSPSGDTPQAEQRQLSSFSDSLDTPRSVIPDSQPEPPATEADDRNLEQTPVEDIQVARSFPVEVVSSGKRRRVDTASSPTNNVETEMRIPSSLPDPDQEKESAGDNQPHTRGERNSPPLASASTRRSTTATALSRAREISLEDCHSLSLSSLPIELHPPPPPVSTEPFKTHITPTLHMLTERLKLPRTYQPVRQTREPDRLERGFWFLRINVVEPDVDLKGNVVGKQQNYGHQGTDERASLVSDRQQKGRTKAPKSAALEGPNPNDWTLPFFTRFWSFLTDFIAKEGRAGWGVWCILEGASPSDNANKKTGKAPELDVPSAQQQSQVPGQDTTIRSLTLKVYAWGEIIPHVYLLLFLASERRIRGMRAEWKDGGEETVIEMP